MGTNGVRLRKNHQDDIRLKIAASLRIARLMRFVNYGQIYESKVGIRSVDGKIAKDGGGAWRMATKEDAPIMALRIRAGFDFLKKIVPDMHEVSGPGGGPIPISMDVSNLTDDELASIAAGRATVDLLARVAAGAKGGGGTGVEAAPEDAGEGMASAAGPTGTGI